MSRVDEQHLLYKDGKLAIYEKPNSGDEHIFYIENRGYGLQRGILKELSNSQGRILDTLNIVDEMISYNLREEKISGSEAKEVIDQAHFAEKMLEAIALGN